MANNEKEKVGLLSTNAEVEPVGVIYNVTGSAVEEFVQGYLQGLKNIDGVAAVRLSVIRDGAERPELALYVLLHQNSKDVVTNMNNIPKHIRNKMDAGSFRASDKLRQAMYPLCKDFKIGVHRENVLYIKCDVFKALGIMLDAEPRVHTINVPSVMRIKKNSIITVIKANKFIDKRDSSVDRFSRIVDDIESR